MLIVADDDVDIWNFVFFLLPFRTFRFAVIDAWFTCSLYYICVLSKYSRNRSAELPYVIEFFQYMLY